MNGGLRTNLVPALGALLLTGLLAATPLAATTVAYTGATLHPVSGPPIAGGTMVVEDGRIATIGAQVSIPPGAEVVDLSGLHVYPGMIHPTSQLGLREIGSVRGTLDVSEIGDNNANVRAEVAFNADSLILPTVAWGGVLSAHVVPGGGTFRGTSAVMRLDGWNWTDMTVATPVGMHVSYPYVLASDDEDDDSSERALATLRDTLDEARAYAKAKSSRRSTDANPRLDALLPVLEGTVPLFVHADEKAQIESALDWAAEEGFDNLVLVTGSDAQYVAERLARDDVPVVLDGVLRLPNRRWEPYDAPFGAAKVLHDAGVRFCIGEGGGASSARNLPFHAARAAAYGLDKEQALRSVTLSAAEILGVADHIGSLEAGKEATFFAADGDPLEIRTHIARIFVQGRELDRENDHQWRLYRRYDERPKASP